MMNQRSCEYCNVRRQYRNLTLGTYALLAGGILVGQLVHPYGRYLDVFVGCLGLAGSGLCAWKNVGVIRRMRRLEETERQVARAGQVS